MEARVGTAFLHKKGFKSGYKFFERYFRQFIGVDGESSPEISEGTGSEALFQSGITPNLEELTIRGRGQRGECSNRMRVPHLVVCHRFTLRVNTNGGFRRNHVGGESVEKFLEIFPLASYRF